MDADRMPYYILLGLVPAATFALVGLACAAIVTALWPRLRAAPCGTAAERARRFAALRFAPVAGAAVAAATLTLTFLRFEPRDTTENPGLLLITGAAVTVLLLGAAARRLLAAIRSSRQCRWLLSTCGSQQTLPDGRPLWIVETDYPVAAVLGVVRARLLVSRRILSECTDTELASVVRHELAHIHRRDNYVQAAMRFLPDPFAHTRTGRELQQAWTEAAEEAADDLASSDAHERTELASALVRVAGMATGRPPRWMPALTFFERSTVDARVRRLLVGSAGVPHPARWAPTTLGAVAGLAILATESVGLRLHALMELAVQVLP